MFYLYKSDSSFFILINFYSINLFLYISLYLLLLICIALVRFYSVEDLHWDLHCLARNSQNHTNKCEALQEFFFPFS